MWSPFYLLFLTVHDIVLTTLERETVSPIPLILRKINSRKTIVIYNEMLNKNQNFDLTVIFDTI